MQAECIYDKQVTAKNESNYSFKARIFKYEDSGVYLSSHPLDFDNEINNVCLSHGELISGDRIFTVQKNIAKEVLILLNKKKPEIGYYRLHNDVWEILEFEGGDKYMKCYGDCDERKGNVPDNLDIDTLPNLDDYDLSNVEY